MSLGRLLASVSTGGQISRDGTHADEKHLKFEPANRHERLTNPFSKTLLQSEGRRRSALRVLQFLPRPPNSESHTRDGSGPHRSRLEFGGIGRIVGT